MVLGDFNSVLSSADKHNGEAVSLYEITDFRACCSDLGLHDVNFTGCHFSWTNGSVWSKLDRVMINPTWSSLHHSTHVHFSPPGAFTDHSPAAVRLGPLEQGRRCFKFFDMWASHADFTSLVSSHWPSHVYGTPMLAMNFVAYYQQLLGTSNATTPIDSAVISCGPCLPSSSFDFLLAPVTHEDIRKAVFSISNDKARGQMDTLLSSTSKHGLWWEAVNTSSPSDFRPISCCNVIYKVIAKILAGRLAHVLKEIVSPMQNAFLGGRFMSDNINLVQELLRQYGRKRSSPRCLLKVNGDIHGFFLGKSGVRQGDPLSPYIFICCMEYFSRMLKLATQQDGFRFHPKCELQGISHLAFADDILLLSRGDPSSVQCLLSQLSLFGQTSGLDINPQKSSIFFGGVADAQKQVILSMSGFKEGSFPFTYLGVPLSPHRLLASQFSPLLMDLKSSVQGGLGLFDLKARNQSFIGKQLWNIHLKTDSVWIRWIHHFYLRDSNVWLVQAHPSSSPLWKAIISVRDFISQSCGDSDESISLMSRWSSAVGPFLSHAYNFFRRLVKPSPGIGCMAWNLIAICFLLASGRERCNMELRMRRVAVAITIYLLWEERNRRIFEGKTREVDTVFRRPPSIGCLALFNVDWLGLHQSLSLLVSFAQCKLLLSPARFGSSYACMEKLMHAWFLREVGSWWGRGLAIWFFGAVLLLVSS
ncbi:uncharacterized protein [Populus alba]|uniref:uncharacterized protein n=1 Tax=Populus alba TaxID=43335 RepID=UPI003CC6F00D